MTQAGRLVVFALACCPAFAADSASVARDERAPVIDTRVGPARGTLFIVGGGNMSGLWPRGAE